MKKLTKILSLVLVIAMVVSLCVVGASAKTFNDSDKVTANYKEAVDILSDIGVIDGMNATTFAPNGNFTRAQACAIVARMTLGADAAKNISASTKTFSDVATNYWGYNYIEYCANSGYVGGMGNGKFAPDSTLTGYQFALMLMRVAGVDTKDCTGANWAINTAKLYYATKLSNVAITNSTIVREAAAQLAFDTLFFSTSSKTGYAVKQVSTNTVVGVYDTVAEATMMASILGNDYTVIPGLYTVLGSNLAKTVFGITKAPNGTDKYGRPATTYTVDSKGSVAQNAAAAKAYGWTNLSKAYAQAAAATYTDGKFNATEITRLTKAGWTGMDTATVVYNGGSDASVKYNTLAKPGYTVELFGTQNANGSYVVSKIVVTESYLAVVTAINAKTGDITLQIRDAGYYLGHSNAYKSVTVAAPVNSAAPSANYAALSSLKANDVVLVTVMPGWDTVGGLTILDVAAVKAVTGTVTATSYTGYYNGYVKIDGTKYTFANDYDQTAITVGGKYTFYVGNDGYVYGATTVTEANANLAFLKNYEASYSASLSGTKSYVKADVAFADGTSKVVDVYVSAAGNINGGTTLLNTVGSNKTSGINTMTDNTWYSYVVMADGTYKLVGMPANYAQKTLTAANVQTPVCINKGAAVMPGIGNASSSTVLTVVYYNATTKAYTKTEYTGFANFPAVNAGEAAVKTNAYGIVDSIVVYTTNSVVTTTTSYAYYTGTAEMTANGQTYGLVVNGVYGEYTLTSATVGGQAIVPGTIYAVAVNGTSATLSAANGTATGKVTGVDAGYVVVNVSGTPTVVYINSKTTNTDVSGLATGTAPAAKGFTVDDTIKYVVATDVTTGLPTIVASFVVG